MVGTEADPTKTWYETSQGWNSEPQNIESSRGGLISIEPQNVEGWNRFAQSFLK